MSKDRSRGWIGTLTEIVLDVERLQAEQEQDVRRLAHTFFTEAIEICQTIRDIHQLEEDSDEDGFLKVLFQCSEDMAAAISSLDRSPVFPKEELCHSMYRFISTLSQRLNFESPDKSA